MKNKQKVRTCGNCINCVKVNPTKNIIDALYGTEVDNKLLTFLKDNE